MDFDGFAYLVKSPASGKEFLLAASFGKSRSAAKRHLHAAQNRRCEQQRPMFEVVEICAARVEAVFAPESAE